MPTVYPPIPPRSDLLDLFRAALSNAKDLLGDAKLLAGVARFPRAFALAVLSSEELSKAHLCLLAVLLDDMTAEDFWKSFRDHASKLNRAHAFAGLMQPAPVTSVVEYTRKVVADSNSTDKQKHRGLYVDYRRGKIQLPSQIGEAGARKKIRAVEESLVLADTAFSAKSLDALLAETETLIDGLKGAMVSYPDDMVMAIQEALRDGSQEKLQALVTKNTAKSSDS